MLLNSLFLIRVWNNRWETQASLRPQSLSIGLHFWALIELRVFCLCEETANENSEFSHFSSWTVHLVIKLGWQRWKVVSRRFGSYIHLCEPYQLPFQNYSNKQMSDQGRWWDGGSWRNFAENCFGRGKTQTSTFPKWWADTLSSESMIWIHHLLFC